MVRVLFANWLLDGPAGAEIVTRDLAIGLRAAGHEPMLYAPGVGAIGREIAAHGIPVVSKLEDLPAPPDIIHGNSHVETIRALDHFRAVPAIFVCHGRLLWQCIPPRFPRIRRYVAVDMFCRERLQTYGIDLHDIRLIHNTVDLDRFTPRDRLPAAPRRALIFGSYNTGYAPHIAPIKAACAAVGIAVDEIGPLSGNVEAAPERLLGQYDLVFAKARCALEAMAVGAAVILCDAQGLGSLVTTANVAAYRDWNFGWGLLIQPLDAARIGAEIARYEPDDAAAVSAYVREHADLHAGIRQYADLYDAVLAEATPGDEQAWTHELAEYLEMMLRTVNAIETDVYELGQQPFYNAQDGQLALAVMQCPARVRSGEPFHAAVSLHNHTPRAVGSYHPAPVYLSYHWFTGDTVAIWDGGRVAIRPPVQPATARTLHVPVTAPAAPGTYRLRVTLVQEGMRWVDECLAEVTVIVGEQEAP